MATDVALGSRRNRQEASFLIGFSVPIRKEDDHKKPRAAKLETLLVDLFLEAHAKPPMRTIIDPDATDETLHGHQEGLFFHGYYGCYCYLPLYVFCGRQLLAAKPRPSDIDTSAGAREEIERIVPQIRTRKSQTR